MSNVLRLAIVDPNDTTREELKNVLLGMGTVWLEAECSRYEFFGDVVGQTHPDIGVIVLDHHPDNGLELVSQLSRAAPECSILVVSSSSDGELILRAMRAGVKEFLTRPLNIEDILGALGRISEQKFGNGEGRARGCSAIAVAGATGGVGSTSVAVNLGCVLAADPNNSVALIDLDMCLGDADVFLDTIPEYTLVDVSQNIARLDFALLKRSLTKHASGLYLLPRPVQLQDASLVTAEDLHRVVGLLKATFSHLIFDLSKSYNALDLIALQAASHVLLVTQLDLPCLRNCVRLMMSFGDMEGVQENVKILVNRVGLSTHIGLKKAEDTIGKEVFCQLPNDYRVMVEVRNNGVPLIEHAPKAGITQSFKMLAEALSSEENTARMGDKRGKDKSGKSNWLAFLGQKATK